MKTQPPDWAIVTAADRAALAAGYYWDWEQANRIIEFAELHLRPQYVSGEFGLFEWQCRFLMRLYGWRRPDGGRRFRRALLHVPKKNGKTLLVSVVAAYELYAAQGSSPLVVSASTTRSNATQVYQQLRNSIKLNKKLAAVSKMTDSKKTIRVEKRDAEYLALSADAPTSEGLNCSAVIVDEAHAHRSPKLYQTLEYAWVGRENGFMLVISTAGDDLTHWYYGLVEQGRGILSGADTDPEFLAAIYEATPEDDLEDPEVWKRVNPSLDLYPGFTVEAFRNSLKTAKRRTATWINFRRYRLNIFTRDEDQTYIDVAHWDSLTAPMDERQLLDADCWLALDASQTTDPTSLAGVWMFGDRKFYAKSWAWVAEAGVQAREKSNLPKYGEFIAAGCMTSTSGNVIDKDAVKAKILALRAAGHRIKALTLDPNGLWVLGAELMEEGIEVFRMPQNYRHFNEPTKELANVIAAKRMYHDGSPWLRYCLHNVRLDVDEYGNQRPSRKKSRDKIDGAVSLIMAFALAWKSSAEVKPKKSVYDTQGIDW